MQIEPLPTDETKDLPTEALMRSVTQQFEHVVGISKNIQPEALINVVNTEEPGRLADVITPYLRQMRVRAAAGDSGDARCRANGCTNSRSS